MRKCHCGAHATLREDTLAPHLVFCSSECQVAHYNKLAAVSVGSPVEGPAAHTRTAATRGLIDAIRARDLNTVKKLVKLKEGIDINYQDANGWTPLHVAADNDETEIVSVLLKNGADAKIKNNNGDTPFHIAMSSSLETERALEDASNWDAQNNNGDTPLHIHLRNGPTYMEYIEELIEHANLKLLNRNGQSVLHAAVIGNNDDDIIEKILEIEPSLESKTDRFGKKASDYATRRYSVFFRRNASSKKP